MTECKKCGECCRTISFVVKDVHKDKDKMEYLLARGIEVEGDNVIVPHVCQHLKDNLCSIQDTKPKICKIYAGQAGYNIPKGCAFESPYRED